jgi:UDP-glucose 4-epimerase
MGRETEMRICVSGGAGFIGSHLTDRLIDEGHKVTVIDNLSTGKKENLNDEAEFIYADVSHDINEIFRKGKFDYVFHLAALPSVQRSVEHPVHTHNNNLTGTINILNLSHKYGVKKLVYAASSSAYGLNKTPMHEDMKTDPLSPYAAQKVMGEIYCKIYNDLYGLPTVSTRFFNVYGPRQNDTGCYAPVMAKFSKLIDEGKLLTIVGDGEQKRDFTFIDDVIDGLMLAMFSDISGEIFNLGRGHSVSVNEVAEIMAPGETREYLPFREGEIRDSLADISKTIKVLGWNPTIDVETGITILRKK